VDNDVGVISFRAQGQTYGYAVSYFAVGMADAFDVVVVARSVGRLAWAYFSEKCGALAPQS
jgi:hypothetical protein